MKYEIKETKNDRGLFQIKALEDFGDVKAGDLCGYIESEKNLSQEGLCWVSGNAQVSGNAWVSDVVWPVKRLGGKRSEGQNHHKLGFDLTGKSHPNKKKLLNNCVVPEIGFEILNAARNIITDRKVESGKLF